MGDESADTDRSTTPIPSMARRARDGTFALVGGAIALLVAVRAAGSSRLRALAGALVGIGLIRYGIRKRRLADDRNGPAGRDSETEQLGSADQREPLVDAAAGETHRREPSGPGHTSDEGVSIDISSPATADEPGEAVGPDSAHAQPTQTEATEPEADPDADVGGDHVDDGESGEADIGDERAADAGAADAESDVEDADATRSGAGPDDPDGPGGSPTN